MSNFKTTLINCQQCNRRIMVRAADAERGSITCSHVGCGAVNELAKAFHYDDSILRGLPNFGKLTYLGDPSTAYPLQFGPNVIGTGDGCAVRVDRFVHNGKCFISRRHCTLTVTFDKWTGQLRYCLQDGAVDAATQTKQSSLNGTQLNGAPLQKSEDIDVASEGIITLGAVDRFELTAYAIPPAMLKTYKVELEFNPDRTQ